MGTETSIFGKLGKILFRLNWRDDFRMCDPRDN